MTGFPLSPLPPARRRLRRRLFALICLAALTGCASETTILPAADGRLRIGTSLDYHPFSSVVLGGRSDGDVIAAGRIGGFDIAVGQAFAAARGQAGIDWQHFKWPELHRDFEARRFDIAMSGVTVRPERSVAGRFSVPVAVSGAVAIVRDGFEREISALGRSGVVLCVNAGGHLERVTRKRFPEATIVAVPDNALVMRELREGRADAAITDLHEVASWIAGAEELAVVGPFTRDYKAYWVQPGREALAGELDAWLMASERDGTLAELRTRYFGPGDWERTALPAAALDAAIAERRALMPLVAEAKRNSGAAVEDRAREAVVIASGVASVGRTADLLGVAAPAEAAVRAFYENEISEAKRIQRATLAQPRPAGTRVFDLKADLRPALLRIGEKIAMLLVQREAAATSR